MDKFEVPDNLSNSPIDILLVDDRPENLLALEAVLASPGYRLFKATSGEGALRYLLDHDPVLILMDVQMPELDGFQTAEIIKQSERTRSIPIIFVTAINKDERFVHQGYRGGAVDYLYKPFDDTILRSKVAVFADLDRKTRRLLAVERMLRENEGRERQRQLHELELKSLRREHAQQQKYRDLVESIHQGVVWLADAASMSFSFVGPGANRILGYSESQWLEDPGFWERSQHPEDRAGVAQALKQLRVDECHEVRFQHRMISANGAALWFDTGVRISSKGDGLGPEFRGLSVDITRVKEAEVAERRSKERASFLAQASLALSASLDPATTLKKIGELAVPLLADWVGIDQVSDSGRIESLSWAQVDPSKDDNLKTPTGVAGVIREVIQSGESELVEDIGARLLQGDSVPGEVRESIVSEGLQSAIVVPLKARGCVFGALTLVSAESSRQYDAADRALAEDLALRVAAALDSSSLYERAQAAIRARDEFLSIASHELKTPLTPLKLQTQSLMRSLSKTGALEVAPARIMKMVKSSDRQISRLSDLIEELLDVARIRNGKLGLHLEKFNVVELVQDVLDRFEEQLLEVGCSVEFEVGPEVQIEADRFRLEQVLVNLLTNAMKYGPGKPVHIALEVQGPLFRLSVRDHGIGIAPLDQARIFERFERAVGGDSVAGLGLGLYIVTHILHAHEGRIWVESETGVGSNFVIEIPALPSMAQGLKGLPVSSVSPKEVDSRHLS